MNVHQAQIEDIARTCTVTVHFVEAIHRAINACGPEVAAQIIQQGLTKAGKTVETTWNGNIFKALHRAAFEGRTEVVRLLLTFPNAQELALMEDYAGGFTGFHWAANNGHKGVVALFLALPIAQDLLAKKSSANATVLHYIAYNGRTEVMRLMLALPNAQELAMAQNNYGETPLHTAAKGGKRNIVELLVSSLNAQALAGIKTVTGNTAYDVTADPEIKALLWPYQSYRCVQVANRTFDFLKFMVTAPFQ